MSGTVTVEPDPAYQAGHAVIRVHGAARFAGPANFRIRRDDYNDSVFGAKGWQVADELLSPDANSVEGDDLLLHIGPSIVQQIVNGVYHIAIPAAQVETTIVWPDLPLLADGALNIVAEPVRAAARAVPAPRPQIQRPMSERSQPRPEAAMQSTLESPSVTASAVGETIRPPPTSSETPASTTLAARRAPWLLLALVLLLLLLISGGGYLGYRWIYPPAPNVAAGTPPGGSPVAHGPADGSSQSHTPPGTDLEHMTAVDAVRSGALPKALLHEAERRMLLGNPQRNDALLLMQAAADRNYAPAHAALGRFYDPALHPPDVQPDPRQAALHYRAAMQGGDNSVAEARAALRTYLERQPNDLYAPLILKEFWP